MSDVQNQPLDPEEMARRAVLSHDPRMLEEAIRQKGERLWVLDHPITFWKTGVYRDSGTLQAFAVSNLFTAANRALSPGVTGREANAAVVGAASICRRLIELGAPAFISKNGSGCEDDHTYVAARFVGMLWRPHAQAEIAQLFQECVRAGLINLEEPLGDEFAIIGSLLPVDAAIRVGNPDAAGAAVRAGARTDHIARDEMGREMDLVAYIHKSGMQGTTERTAASVAQALMERTIRSTPTPSREPTHQAPVRRARASV